MTLTRPFRSLNVLRQRHLATLWVAQVFSAIGDQLYDVAIVWLSVQIVGSEAGFVLAAGSISNLVFGLLGGVYADRWDRRRTLIGADILRAMAVLTLPAAAVIGEITLVHLAIVAAIVGGLTSLFEPTLQASLPSLTRDTQSLQAANALMDVTVRLAFIFGPGLAGVLIALLPLPHFFTLDAITFFISALAILSIRHHFPSQGPIASDEAQSVVKDIRNALGLIKQNTALSWAIVNIGLTNMLWSASFIVGAALLVDRKFEAEVGAYGLLIAAYGVGNVLSNLVVGGLTIDRQRRAFIHFCGSVMLGLGFIIVGFAPTYPIALLGAMIAALGGPMTDVMLLLMIQQDFPANQVGKIYSVRMTTSSAGYSLGLMLAASLFAVTQPDQGILICALGILFVGLVGVLRFWRG